jgi:hypothetical protein
MRVKSLSCRPRWHLVPHGNGAQWREFTPNETRFEELSGGEAARALLLWRYGLDTADISESLGVPEFVVFNTLRARRELAQREVAA